MLSHKQLAKRLKAEKKVLQRKQNEALRNGKYVSSKELARLRRVSGRIEKESVYSLDEYEDN